TGSPSTLQIAKPVALSDLDVERAGRLLTSVLPDATGFAICNVDGEPVWRGPGDDACEAGIRVLNERVPGWAGDTMGVCRRSISVTESVLHVALVNELGASAGALVAAVTHSSGDDRHKALEQVREPLALAAECIGRELSLCQDVNALADEIGQRHEELNLLYDTRDNVKYFDESQDALRKLVRNTADFLRLGMAAVVMAEKNITVAHTNPSSPLQNAGLVLRAATSTLYDEARISSKPIVLNQNGDSQHMDIARSVQCKVLCSPIYDENAGIIGVFVIANELNRPDFVASDIRLAAAMARKAGRIIQANYDSLTGMMTRHGFEYHLETALYVVRYKRVAHCVLHINLDRLHVVNDSSSHYAGDEMIRRVGAQIRNHLRDSDVVARTGGDEFGVLLADCSLDEGERIAEAIRQSVATMEFKWDQRRFEVSVSIGAADMGPESEGIVSVLGAAEVACSAAKDSGRNRVKVYAQGDDQLRQRRDQIEWIGQIHNGLREDNFVLYSQLIDPLQKSTNAVHVEVLLRMKCDDGSVIGPDSFVPSAERYNLMPAIDRWVVRNTLKALVTNLPSYAMEGNVWAINLSGQSLSDPMFREFITREVAQSGVPPGSLCFEVTETAAVTNLSDAVHFITSLKEQGFRFSLDDFGTGVSSFAYLKSLPVDYLKIDGTFVKEIVGDKVSRTMVASINEIGHVMELRTIAEFVENDQIRTLLTNMGVDYAQGYGVGKPRPLLDMLEELAPQPQEVAVPALASAG
ncbi:MAG: EAL domain-containing protein, partial [Pseudomonadota bacterium]